MSTADHANLNLGPHFSFISAHNDVRKEQSHTVTYQTFDMIIKCPDVLT